MNLAHLHLVMNHVPTIGAVAAVGLLLLAFVRRNEHLERAGLEVLFVIAVLTLPVFVSGLAAYHEIRDRADISVDAVMIHQDAALIGFSVMEFAGFVGWVALWQSRRRGRAARGVVPAATVLLVVALVIMGLAANLGGDIRHPEIRAAAGDGTAAPAAGDPERFMASAITRVAVYSTWVWPAAEAVHFLGLSLSIGVLLAVNLRILGVNRQTPFADVHRLLPWGMLGFGVNLITGMFFFVGQPGQYTSSAPFYWKILFLMIAGANFLYLTVFGKAWRRTEGGDASFDASLADKAMAVSSIAAWLLVLYEGRMLPFLGTSF
jgi:hypothetical protein